jgi:hypothetical protein
VITGKRPLRGSGAMRGSRWSGGLAIVTTAECDPTATRSAAATEMRADLLAALADVVGTEPTPSQPRAPHRAPRPGLGPLSVLHYAVSRLAAQMRGERLSADSAVGELERLVRHGLPSDTPDWSAYLLIEDVSRWTSEAYWGWGAVSGEGRK